MVTTIAPPARRAASLDPLREHTASALTALDLLQDLEDVLAENDRLRDIVANLVSERQQRIAAVREFAVFDPTPATPEH